MILLVLFNFNLTKFVVDKKGIILGFSDKKIDQDNFGIAIYH